MLALAKSELRATTSHQKPSVSSVPKTYEKKVLLQKSIVGISSHVDSPTTNQPFSLSLATPARKTHHSAPCAGQQVNVEIICKDVDVTPISCTSSAKKVTILVDSNIIVGSIDDDVDYGQPDFNKAVEDVGSADDYVDFGSPDNNHVEENAEKKMLVDNQRRRTLGHWMLFLLWIQMFCVTFFSGKLKKGILQRLVTEAIVTRKV